ncbi:hypothetical protein [Bacillus sp. 165]|uniref:hypothetical protein n=1 Tax=Bacillus sp. 165 TaxID=1529117 RepID=UPI001AD9AB94|nr:hypothetical protein [Bacillus sp. 165]MBO9128730.1 hypothetical protein [Bacillus sp. 165]
MDICLFLHIRRHILLSAIYIPFALIVLFYANFMTHTLCRQKDMSEKRETRTFRTINVCITILLISSYIEFIHA